MGREHDPTSNRPALQIREFQEMLPVQRLLHHQHSVEEKHDQMQYMDHVPTPLERVRIPTRVVITY
jgi:hypothetical protein